jgi:hypothetical protein
MEVDGYVATRAEQFRVIQHLCENAAIQGAVMVNESGLRFPNESPFIADQG